MQQEVAKRPDFFHDLDGCGHLAACAVVDADEEHSLAHHCGLLTKLDGESVHGSTTQRSVAPNLGDERQLMCRARGEHRRDRAVVAEGGARRRGRRHSAREGTEHRDLLGARRSQVFL
jgi:hypothetical protein